MSEKDDTTKNVDEEQIVTTDGLYGISEAPKEHPENEKGNLKVIME